MLYIAGGVFRRILCQEGQFIHPISSLLSVPLSLILHIVYFVKGSLSPKFCLPLFPLYQTFFFASELSSFIAKLPLPPGDNEPTCHLFQDQARFFGPYTHFECALSQTCRFSSSSEDLSSCDKRNIYEPDTCHVFLIILISGFFFQG